MASLMAVAPEPPTELGRLRVLSSTAGIRVSPLALGAMSIGNGWEAAMGPNTKEDSFKLLDAYVAAGGNFIDTANNYQDEDSEVWIGEWMQQRKNRDRLVIATKFTADYRSYAEGPGNIANSAGNHRRSIHVSVRDSMRKLQTDYIDILYMHWWDFTTSIEEIMNTLHSYVERGQVMYLGISDCPAWIVAAANTYATSHGKTPFSIYQGRWNLLCRDFEREIIPMARHFGMALAPFGVLGSGMFQTREAAAAREKSGQGFRPFNGVQTDQQRAASDALVEVAAEHGSSVSLTAIALAYVRAKAPQVFPIVGGRKVEQLHDNISALSINLTEEQIKKLEAVAPFEVGFPHDFLGDDPFVTGKQTFRLSLSAQMAFPTPLSHR